MDVQWDWVVALVAGGVCAGCFYQLKNQNNHRRAISQCQSFQAVSKLIDYMHENDIDTLELAAITGRVKALGTPIVSKYLNDVTGVMCEQSVVEHKRSWSYMHQDWCDDDNIISFAAQSIPFALTDGMKTIAVHSPNVTIDSPLQLVYDRFEPKSESNVFNHIFNFAVGSETKGFQYLEKILPVNTILTAVGTIKKSGDDLVISPPKQLPYVISRKSLVEIGEDLKQKTFTPKLVIFISGTIAISALSYIVWKKWKVYSDKRRLELLRAQVEEQRNNNTNVTQETCVVCLENPRGTVLIPCGHVCMCLVCSDGITQCPVCRTEVNRIIKTYNS